MKVLPYEQAFLDHMNLEAGKEPANLEDIYEAIDIQQDPWNFITGPPLPDLWKTSSTCPPDFEEVCFLALVLVPNFFDQSCLQKQAYRATVSALLVQANGGPHPSHDARSCDARTQAELDLNARVLASVSENGKRTATPTGAPRRRRRPNNTPPSAHLDLTGGDLASELTDAELAAVLSAEETARFLHFGFSDADVAAATQIEMQHKKEQRRAKRQPHIPTCDPAVSFHPRLGLRVVDERGLRQSRLFVCSAANATPDGKGNGNGNGKGKGRATAPPTPPPTPPTEADSPPELTEAEVAWLERPVTPPAPRRPETSTAALHRALSGYANPDAPLVWSPNRTPAELQRELRMEMDGPSCCLREARAAAAATDRSPAWLASPVIDLTESPEDAAFWVDLAASAGAHLPFIKQEKPDEKEKENQPDNQQKPKGR